MRDLLEDIRDPTDGPTEQARKAARPQLRRRFFEHVAVADDEAGEGFAIRLDGRAVRTPARRLLAAPARSLADALAAEWDAQRAVVDPAQMPLTRLANSIIDGVSEATGPVTAEIVKFLHSDLLCYRAGEPAGLVALQATHWDPVLAFARERWGARFILAEGVVFVAQPPAAVAAAAAAIPADPWQLGALHSVTTLTGSALLALAVCEGRLSAAEAWSAAHVDEDWQMAKWGYDDLAVQRRAFRQQDMQAAVIVLEALRPKS